MTGMAAHPSPAVRGTTALDDVSKSIIEQLQQDGRRSYASIGKAVGLSEAAVRQRVQRLTEAGVMQIVAVTDPLQLGFDSRTDTTDAGSTSTAPCSRLPTRCRRWRRSSTS